MLTCLAILLKHWKHDNVIYNNFSMLSGQNSPLQDKKHKLSSLLSHHILVKFSESKHFGTQNCYLRSLPPVMNRDNRKHLRIVPTLLCISKAVSTIVLTNIKLQAIQNKKLQCCTNYITYFCMAIIPKPPYEKEWHAGKNI